MAKMIMVTRNNEPVDIDEKDFDAALKQGLEPAMEYADKDGQTQVVRKSHQAKAEASGLKPMSIYQGQQSASKVKDKLSEGFRGDLEAGARGLANAATLGFSDELSGAAQAAKGAYNKGSLSDLKSDYTKGRDEYRSREDAAWDDGGLQRKILYGAGAALPTLASLGASLPAQGVKQAAILGTKYGAAGAAGGGTGQGQTDLTKGEYGQYAKDLALGGALGGVIGGGLQKGIEALPKIPGALESFARSRATKAAGGDSAKAGRLVDRMPGGKEAFGKDLLESGIVSGGKTRQQMLDKAREIEESSGKNIGDILGQFDSLASQKGYKSDALKRVLDRAQKEVLEPLNESPATRELADRVNNKYIGRLEEYVKAKDMGPKSPNDSSLGFKGLQNERRLLDKTAFNETGLDKPLNDKLQAVRRIFNEELLKDAEKVAPKELLDEYARQNRLYGVSTTAKKLTEEQLARQAKNRSISLTDYISGGASGAAGAAAAGPAGLIMAPAAIGLNKLARERGNQLLAGGADKLAKFLKGGAPRSIEERMASEGGFIGEGDRIPSSYLREADELSKVGSSVDQPSVLNKSRMSRDDVLNEQSQLRFGKDYKDLNLKQRSEMPDVDQRTKEQMIEDLNNTFKNTSNSKIAEEMSPGYRPKSNQTFVEDPNDAIRPQIRGKNRQGSDLDLSDYVPAVDRGKPERKTFDSTVDVLKDMYRRYKGSKVGDEGGFVGNKPNKLNPILNKSDNEKLLIQGKTYNELKDEMINERAKNYYNKNYNDLSVEDQNKILSKVESKLDQKIKRQEELKVKDAKREEDALNLEQEFKEKAAAFKKLPKEEQDKIKQAELNRSNQAKAKKQKIEEERKAQKLATFFRKEKEKNQRRLDRYKEMSEERRKKAIEEWDETY